MRNSTGFASIVALLVAVGGSARAKSVIVQLDTPDILSGNSEVLGGYHIVSLKVPDDVYGKRLDTVLLEFYVNVVADPSTDANYSATVDVFPLVEQAHVGRAPRFAADYSSSRTAALGSGQRVLFDITDIVKGWIASPSTNHGLIIGSFSGVRAGRIDIVPDIVGSPSRLKATFFYQARSGERVSSR